VIPRRTSERDLETRTVGALYILPPRPRISQELVPVWKETMREETVCAGRDCGKDRGRSISPDRY
jgi:hypothetical protein